MPELRPYSQEDLTSKPSEEILGTDIETETIEKSFVENALTLATSLAKKPSKKLRIFLSLLTLTMGAGYLKKDQLLEKGSELVMQNPQVMKYVDNKFNNRFSLPSSEKMIDDTDSVSMEDDTDPHNDTIEVLKVGEIDLNILRQNSYLKGPDGYDKKDKIHIQDAYLSNILQQNTINVKEATDEMAFREFLKKEIERYFNPPMADQRITDPRAIEKIGFQAGNIDTLITLAQTIVENNLEFDRRTNRWLRSKEDGRLSLRWGKSNPIGATLSTDGKPIDQLLMKEHRGTCRQFSDALCLVVKELKEMYPDRFQNVYVTTFNNSYQWHVYNLVFVVKSPNEVDTFELEPQSGSRSVSAYELLKLMYDRNIISEDVYANTLKQFLNSSKTEESNEDIFAIMDFAIQNDRDDLIKDAKEYILNNNTYSGLTVLRDRKIINDKEYGLAIIDKLANLKEATNFDSEILDETVRLATTSSDKEVKSQAIATLDKIALEADFDKIPIGNFEFMLNDLREAKIIEDEIFLRAGQKLYREQSIFGSNCGFLEFLLLKNEYKPLARALLTKELDRVISYIKYIDAFYDNPDNPKFRDFTIDARYNPIDSWNRTIKAGENEFDLYKKATGEDLVAKYRIEFNKALSELNKHYSQ